MLKIVADSGIPFLQGVLEPWAEVRYIAGRDIKSEDVADADALIVRTRTKCNEQLLKGSKVRFIATATIGFDHIDMEWCRKNGIKVVTSAGCNARGVLQWVAGVLALLSRREGWLPTERTLGVVGVGHVGSLVESYAREWGFNVLCCDPPRAEREEDFSSVDIKELVRVCDIISLHTPLDSSTYHLLDRELLSTMPAHSVIINASRGEVVDNLALENSSHPFALDVWEGEPNISRLLLSRAEVATPHIAGYSLQGKANATAMAVGELANFFDLPLTDWYPSQVSPSKPKPISWHELCRTINHYFDPVQQSKELRSAPDRFEQIRDSYHYREEYF